MTTSNTFNQPKYGKLIREKNNWQIKMITFKKLNKLLNESLLHKPSYQTALDEDRVAQMVESYRTNPDFFIFKDVIIIAIISNKLFVIDGQHRLKMAQILFEKDKINDNLNFCYFKIDTDVQMKALFKEINRDSHKNSNYVSLSEFNESLYDLCKDFMITKYKEYFTINKVNGTKIFTINGFLDKLVEAKYFDKFNNFNDMEKDIIKKNNEFIKLMSYKRYLSEDKEAFYKCELKCVNDEIIFPLIRNNFIEYLINPNIIVPTHQFKFFKNQSTSNKSLKNTVWTREFGNTTDETCPFYKCKNKIFNNLFGFECGYIISEHNGGKQIISNLKPICRLCNEKMSTSNWKEFKESVKKERQLKKKTKTDIVI